MQHGKLSFQLNLIGVHDVTGYFSYASHKLGEINFSRSVVTCVHKVYDILEGQYFIEFILYIGR